MTPRRRFLLQAVCWAVLLGALGLPGLALAQPLLELPQAETILEELEWPYSAPKPPEKGDFSADGLRAFQQELLNVYGGDYLQVPLEVKAEFFEWAMWKYSRSPWHQIHCRVTLPHEKGQPIVYQGGSDTSTWNGALLSALSYKYAVTKDAQTLQRVAEVLQGLHFYQQVTGYSGLVARSVVQMEKPPGPEFNGQFVGEDGRLYYYWSDAAKGTYNYIMGGYAAMMMHVYADLPLEVKTMAHADMTAMILHLLRHNYRITERTGKATRYGDMTPRLGAHGVPFNAQVAYQIVAVGYHFPPEDKNERTVIVQALSDLRGKHHVYYEDPRKHLIRPQRVGASPLVKGMNDRNHGMNAAFMSLCMDLHAAETLPRAVDHEFLYRMGRSMYWGMQELQGKRNSLCNFMWAAMLTNPKAQASIIPEDRQALLTQMAADLESGVQQLRHFPLDRFNWEGQEVETKTPQWVDHFRPDDYHWKCNPLTAKQVTGPSSNVLFSGRDFLHAYWLMRLYRLDEHPAAQPHRAVLVRSTPVAAPGPVLVNPAPNP